MLEGDTRMSAMPKRIQRKIVAGWKMPPGSVYVGGASVFGNRWKVGAWSTTLGRCVESNAEAVDVFRQVMGHGSEAAPWRAYARKMLGGKDLVCWCPLDKPCHADVLLEIANA